jgi:Flp pilus assembly CpaF family ATPase
MTTGYPDADLDHQRLVSWLRGRVATRLAADPAGGQQPAQVEHLIETELDTYARAALRDGHPPVEAAARAWVARAVRDGLLHLGGFQPYLDDPTVENITCNGADRVHVTYADGQKVRVDPVCGSDQELVELVRQVAARAGAEERRFDRGMPRLSVQLPDGSRLFAVMAVCARPSVTIRRHRYLRVDLPQLRKLGSIDDRLEDLLTALVLARRNLLISGGTNSGKTTLLRALAGVIPAGERLVTVEDAFELALERHREDVVALQAREPNVEDAGEVSMAELVRWALRMSPDRVIVGETRGPEVLPLCLAMSQGNDGSLATVHASSSRGALLRLATYAVQTPQRLSLQAANLLVGGAVHVVVHLGRDPRGRRVVCSVREVAGVDGAQIATNELFRPGPDQRAAVAVPPSQQLWEQLLAAGAPPGLFQPGGSR